MLATTQHRHQSARVDDSHEPSAQLSYCEPAKYQLWLQSTFAGLYHPLGLTLQITQDNFMMVKSQPRNAVYAKVNAVTEIIYTLPISWPLLGLLQKRFELELGALSEKVFAKYNKFTSYKISRDLWPRFIGHFPLNVKRL